MPNFNRLQVATVREYTGGLNTVTSDLNLSTNYSVIEENMYSGLSGTKNKRFGTKLFLDINNPNNTIYSFLYKKENITQHFYDYELQIPVNIYTNFWKNNHITTFKTLNPEELFTDADLNNTYNTYTVVSELIPSIQGGSIKYSFSSTREVHKGLFTHGKILANYETLVNNNDLKQYANIKMPVSYYTGELNSEGNDIRASIIASYNDYTTIKKPDKIFINGQIINIDRNKFTYEGLEAGDDIIKIESCSENFFENFDNKEVVFKCLDADGAEKSINIGQFSIRSKQPSENFEITEEKEILIPSNIDVFNKFSEGSLIKLKDNNNNDVIFKVISKTDGKFVVETVNNDANFTIDTYYNGTNYEISSERSIVNITYYLDKLIAVTSLGEVLSIDGNKNIQTLFNNEIASKINNNSVSGWDNTEHVCFTVFNGILTLWNGKNKPLYVDFNQKYTCNYIVDEATQTNTMIPIAKYAIAMNHYLVCGNIYDEKEGIWRPDRIMISDYDAIGTFNDGSVSTLENGGIYVDIGKIVSTDSPEIRGLSRYRTQLVIGFDDVSVFGTLGETINQVDENNVTYKLHNPRFDDVINNYGCVNHRTFQNIVGDLGCLSLNGVEIFKKQVYNTMTVANYISKIISNLLSTSLKDLTQYQLINNIWSVYNPREQQYLLFIPNKDTNYRDYLCFAYTIPQFSQTNSMSGAWSLFTGWNFNCGCVSALNDVFFVDGTKIYIYGNEDHPYYADFVDDPQYPVDPETGLDGKEIKFAWEFAWRDMNNRHAKKTLRYISISSKGSAKFTFGTWYDYIKTDEPEQKIDLLGGDAPGYGNEYQPYGGGRVTNSEKLFAYTAKFNLIKMKIYGNSKKDLKINSFSVFYLVGNMRR